MKMHWKELLQYSDGRVVVCPFGLWSVNEKLNIYSPHTMAASVFSDHQDNEGGSVLCDFIVASEWFASNLRSDDIIFMKINCEGSECTIIENLVRSDELRKVTSFMIDFDAYKIPSQRHAPVRLLHLLDQHKYYNFVTCEQVMHGATHFDRICNWIGKTNINKHG